LYFKIPTLFWIDAGDSSLHGACLAGVVLSVVLIAGYAPVPVLFLLWLLYLSLLNVAQVFLSFQWDTLLLEVGFLAIFLAPLKLHPRLNTEPPPSKFVLWLYRFLLFRLIFASGVMKWLSGDEAWRSMTALQFHYETQPLPTWIGWYAHQLPDAFHTFSVACVFFLQWVVPFFIFLPRRRHIACALLVGFQFLILLTGNYCFFNWMTIGLCLLLLDDTFWRRVLPVRCVSGFTVSGVREKEFFVKGWIAGLAGILILFLSVTFYLVPMLSRNFDPPALARDLFSGVQPFRIVNRYGLFAVMTTSRPEIIVEGSEDGRDWRAYEFKWKPGNLTRAPAFVAPHQPRLDWQMWFAALGNYERNPWFVRFVARLLEGSEPVLKLLAHNPFPDKPPRFIRAILYDYRFTNFAEWEKDTSFWKRKESGLYLPPVQLPRF
ncbi:MAG: lipase maturation factor family protein, partial [Nitrospinae bacterium]|nr:lipase maturation factor family protein [Nitrospinota bacterium]